MNRTYSYVIGKTNLTLVLNNKHYIYSIDSLVAKDIISAIKKGSSDKIIEGIISLNSRMKEYIQKGISILDNACIFDNTVYIDGIEISSELSEQIIKYYNNNLPIEPIVKFVQKLRKNPSMRIKEQLWNFINASEKSGGFTLSEDGDVVAYKKVQANYKDIYSNIFDNSIGNTIEIDREIVDDDPENTCSVGLHFCAYSYLEHYAKSIDSRIMIVKINPADIVSIPTDYSYAKGRCCKYTVIGEIFNNKPITDSIFYKDIITEDMIYKASEKMTSKELCELYRKIINSDKPKKFETKPVGIKRITKRINELNKSSELYKTLYKIFNFSKEIDK